MSLVLSGLIRMQTFVLEEYGWRGCWDESRCLRLYSEVVIWSGSCEGICVTVLCTAVFPLPQ